MPKLKCLSRCCGAHRSLIKHNAFCRWIHSERRDLPNRESSLNQITSI